MNEQLNTNDLFTLLYDFKYKNRYDKKILKMIENLEDEIIKKLVLKELKNNDDN